MRRYASLRGRREFALVMRRGANASSANLTIFALRPNAAKQTKVGIITTRKVGTAVERNLLRRRCKAIVDRSQAPESGLWFVVQCRPSAAALTYAQLDAELARGLAESTRRAGDRQAHREAKHR